jgi:hypothetical protein
MQTPRARRAARDGGRSKRVHTQEIEALEETTESRGKAVEAARDAAVVVIEGALRRKHRIETYSETGI